MYELLELSRDELGSDHHVTLMVYGFNDYVKGDKNAQVVSSFVLFCGSLRSILSFLL